MAASVKDVAAAASVSVGTVSNVLNRPEKVAPETVARVQAAIAQLGFVRNDAARQLRAGRSRSIGLVVLDTANPFFAEVARGAEERADAEGMSILLGNSDQVSARESAYLDLFREQRVNGVLLTPVDLDAAPVQRLVAAGIPVVLVDSELPGEDVPSVAVDDVEGGHLAVAHLLSLGRRRIAFVGGPLSIRQVADRLEGARRALAEVPGATLEVIELDALTVLRGREAGEAIGRREASDRPDAVFCANDLLAVGVLQGTAILGDVRVPDDVALIGYDDIDFAQATVVPLTSVRQPAREIGATAVELLFEALAGGAGLAGDARPARHVRFRPELVVRASTVG
ncbi:MAG: LacI family transcriptional regulator [Microbacterium sp. SCN 70-200]|uniref:LacI family DNA-binding transcriptional regulator n=1 Tax=unclassified Microbacterium TaxID=2609290 RepID=UPI00086B8D37|nr:MULTISPECIES: LacI family DNA-binding transcriptional regulator [unclassified Microbacterium]MBN9215482.1 LacI family DNA-binding transcriptional regulator [Microbacterium sp.]ODT42031.1 MAG: LacI family transcriptional regulator [Microbacterium sp. SCN 70-200]OJV79516.1 MAG: LacI family transcriptional regulator [Microbacterium sp. 70-16]